MARLSSAVVTRPLGHDRVAAQGKAALNRAFWGVFRAWQMVSTRALAGPPAKLANTRPISARLLALRGGAKDD